MKFSNLNIIWTEGKNLALPGLLSRTIDEEHFTKTRDITVEIPEDLNFFLAKHHLQTTSNANTAYVTIPMTKIQKKHITQY